MKKPLLIFVFLLPLLAAAQTPDTTGIYRDRQDSLDAAVFSARQPMVGKHSGARVETINAAGLCKMACCSLAESFENSASVSVGYSDAVTGARQIRLLGLSGVYTQMLDENRPVMRGLASPFGLSYVPGQWLESIQIAKGASSVINGVESITGQINMEHRKPTDEIPLFINASFMSDTKADFNVASSLQINDSWSTVLLGHVCGNFIGMDSNGDGFLDQPEQLEFNVSNRWLYYSPDGVQVRFGVRALRDRRLGGQVDPSRPHHAAYDKDSYVMYGTPGEGESNLWGSEILNRAAGAYLKVGVPVSEDGEQNIAAVLDYTYQNMDAHFGSTYYLAGQHSGFLNLLYQNHIREIHHVTVGVGATFDSYDEDMLRPLEELPLFEKETGTASIKGITNLANVGVFGEYTFHGGDKFTSIVGLRGDWYSLPGLSRHGLRLSPRVTLRYAPVEQFVLRANAGRGIRFSSPLIDNIGVFSTSRYFTGSYADRSLEDAWVFGGNATVYFKLGAGDDAYVSVDYFRTQFVQQKLVDYNLYYDGKLGFDRGFLAFYDLTDVSHGRSFTDSWQIDFSCEPVERFTINLTGRYTNAKATYKLAPDVSQGILCERPMTSRFKAVLNLQYATNLNKWIFDFTASLNGSCKVYDFMADRCDPSGKPFYRKGRTPVYPLLYLQVTKRFKGVDIYVGGENLTNFRQKDVILGQDSSGRTNPALPYFDASCVWGPIMGISAYAGVRFTLWKTEKQ